MPNVFDRLGGASSSLAFKAPCRIATTANITLSGYQTIDGVLPTSSEHEVLRRVLVKSQTTTSQNGIYVMSAGEWERAKDFNGNTDFVRGTRVYVWGGSTQSGPWIVTSSMSPDTFVMNTDTIVFELIDTEIGEQGEDGVTPTFSIGTVTTLGSTASATVALNETSTSVYSFDFGIPEGADGVGTGTITSIAPGFGMNFSTITTTGSIVLHAGYIVDIGNAI